MDVGRLVDKVFWDVLRSMMGTMGDKRSIRPARALYDSL